jgi:NTP pyrophosphatase (non-canonical NTP hydrolase)
MTVCAEELAELIQALSKYQRLFGGQPPRKDADAIRADIIEEIADVEVMLEQVREFLEIEPKEVSEIIDKKLDRTIRIIEGMKEERIRR